MKREKLFKKKNAKVSCLKVYKIIQNIQNGRVDQDANLAVSENLIMLGF